VYIKNLNGWPFLLIALLWLPPLVNVDIGVSSALLQVIALAVIGFMGIKGK